MLFCIFLISTVIQVTAQTGTVSGKVTDSKGNPMQGVTVSVKGGKAMVMTDQNGRFTITAASGDVLEITNVGFTSRDISVTPGKEIGISLSESAGNLEDVVVVGYGTQRKKDLTGSVGVVKIDEAKKTASYDVAKMLQGQVAGVTVHGSGEPGGFVQIKIRGVSSFTNNNPLFVVDGVPLSAPFDFNPGDIESIQVLKDASAGAIYGSRAATGVVIITTKKGKAGALKVQYNGYAGAQWNPRKLPLTGREDYQRIVTAAELNAGLSIAPANDPSSPSYVTDVNTDWQEEGMKTGIIQDHNVGFSGGSEAARYNISLGYFDQEGTYRGPQKYNRYSLNANLDGRKGIFSYGAKFAYSQSDKTAPFNDMGSRAVFGGMVTSLVTAFPTIPVHDPTHKGGFGGPAETIYRGIMLNVIGMNALLDNKNQRGRMLGSVWGELELMKGLKYRLNLSYDRTDWKDTYFEPEFEMGTYYTNTLSLLRDNRGINNSTVAENLLTYKKDFGKHGIDLLGGLTYQYERGEGIYASARGLTEPYYPNFEQAPAEGKTVSSGYQENAILSYLGRVNYNYDDRYLLTVNFRRDGSSRFEAANRWGNFASVAAAWNIHNEHFIQLPDLISSLKLRGGYGELGNQNIGNYLYQAFVNTNASYVFNGQLAPGTSTINVVDPALQWETKVTSYLGFDAGLLNEKFTVSAEYYRNTNKDLLFGLPIPLTVGSFPSNITTNAASLRNSGVELSLGYRNSEGKFKYGLNANMHTVKNEVLKLGDNNDPVYGAGSKTEVGRSVGEIFVYQTAGLFNSQEDIAKHAQQVNAAPGDVRFVDANGDGVINDLDRVYQGNSIPKVYFGLNANASYGNFDFSMFWQGHAGNKVVNGIYHDLMLGLYANYHTDFLNYWTPTNTNTNVPRPVIGDPNGNARLSDRFVESGNYIRLQNFQVGYTVPAAALSFTKVISSLRFYVSGQNALTISKYKGYDPDFMSDGLYSRGFDIGSWPNPRTYMFGIQAGF